MSVPAPDPLRIAQLVADSMGMVLAGWERGAAAITLVRRHRPTQHELALAHRHNLLVHGRGEPEVPEPSRTSAAPVSGEAVRLRNAIQHVLEDAHRLLPPAPRVAD